jgi:hypothetical protein
VFIEESYVQKKAALRTNQYKYIHAVDNDGWCNYCQKVHIGKEELYNLEKDPREINDIAQQEKSIALRMKQQLLDIISSLDEKRMKNLSHRNGTIEQEPLKDSSENALIKKQFKKLGYM